MNKVDVAIIGAGVLGCFAARALSRYDLRVAVLEKGEDVCTGITRANTAIVYSGYDSKPGSFKTRLCVEANRRFAALCEELSVPFLRCGSLMIAFGPQGEEHLRLRYMQGKQNGVDALSLLDRTQILEKEPNINPNVTLALYAPTTGTVNPWEFGLAAAQNAMQNGVRFCLNTSVEAIRKTGDGYVIETAREAFVARTVLNCAGLYADAISELVNAPVFRITPSRAEYIVLDDKIRGFINHVIFHEPEDHSKGATIVPTVDGNLLLGPSRVEVQSKDDFVTTSQGLDFVRNICRFVVPNLPFDLAIRNFAGLRPNIYETVIGPNGTIALSRRSINEFYIDEPKDAPGFVSLAGIKTPGLTCAALLGEQAVMRLLKWLGDVCERRDFNPRRFAPVRFARQLELGHRDENIPSTIICRCRNVTEAEIRATIRGPLGATTLDGVKRRTGAQMGRCQGGFCTRRITEILAQELCVPVWDVKKNAPGSELLRGGDRHESI